MEREAGKLLAPADEVVLDASAGFWSYRRDEHSGDRAYSVFDGAGARLAVGLHHADAVAICLTVNRRLLADGREPAGARQGAQELKRLGG